MSHQTTTKKMTENCFLCTFNGTYATEPQTITLPFVENVSFVYNTWLIYKNTRLKCYIFSTVYKSQHRLYESSYILTRAPLGFLDFHALLGGV